MKRLEENEMKRPRTFAQVALRAKLGVSDFGAALAELIDETANMTPLELSKAMEDEPEIIEDPNQKEAWKDAYLAAAAEHLARKSGIEIPLWAEQSDRFLKRAWFDNHGLKSINAMLIAQSPLAFRRRFIFTEQRPLRRA